MKITVMILTIMACAMVQESQEKLASHSRQPFDNLMDIHRGNNQSYMMPLSDHAPSGNASSGNASSGNASSYHESSYHGPSDHALRDKMVLFNFATTQSVDDWREMSDTVRRVGKSKAVLTLQSSQLFQRAIFFTLLNPQPNGAGFAGVRKLTNLNLSRFKNIEITCRGQGQNSHYTITLRHRRQNSNMDLNYEQFFTVSMSDEFSTVTLPLKDFRPYYHGREIPNGEPLDTANITMIGFQIYGGVYMPIKQHGVSALEIKTIVVS